ncbi:MAG: hypothetical protein V2A61_00125, partial [Calditrichota bacterium]
MRFFLRRYCENILIIQPDYRIPMTAQKNLPADSSLAHMARGIALRWRIIIALLATSLLPVSISSLG